MRLGQLLISGLVFGLSGVANAATFFTDCAVWETAAGGTITTDLFDNDISQADSISFDSGVVSVGTGGLINGASTPINRVNGTSSRYEARIRSATGTSGYLTTTWTFPNPIEGLCIDVTSITNLRGVTIGGDWDGTGDQFTPLYAYFGNISNGSFGVIGVSSFSSITLTASGPNDNDFFQIPNLHFSAPSLPSADLSIVKSNGANYAVPDQSINWTLTIVNTGGNSAMGTTIADVLPARVFSGSWTCNASGTSACVTGGGTGNSVMEVIDIDSGPANQVLITVSATLDSTEGGTLTNTATVTAPGGINDPNTSNNTSTDIDAVGLFVDSFED